MNVRNCYRNRNYKYNGTRCFRKKSEDYVYNLVTQLQAAKLSQEMYSTNTFKSDLINSYAWDTAIVFFQLFDNRVDTNKPYSRQNSANTVELADKGSNNLVKQNKVCNAYDMASNTWEWTTENYNDSGLPCSTRGGSYYQSWYYASLRNHIRLAEQHMTSVHLDQFYTFNYKKVIKYP
ncbi:MAG: hypothetical protein EGQ16_07240 [Clostridiales bacterium]|nr:hypothetical protein [Clostridiales bacterium]MBD9159603.1 hypothetical protein [Clostridiales bacterium]